MFLGVEAANAAATVQTTPATWISLHDGDPGTTGENELGISRQQTTWGAAVDGARGGSEVFFPVAAGTRVTHWGLWTASGGGTFYSGHQVDEETFGHNGVYAILPVVSPGAEVTLAGDGTQAAVLLSWGPVVDGDEFPGNALNLAKWGLYNGPGHANKGLRRPSQIAVANGVLTITGLPNGTTGGMSFNNDRLYGRWESRMRVPPGDYRYHPVLLLWPDAEDWPEGGEVDYAETNCAADDVDFFLHYSEDNLQTHDSVDVDITQWHNYAVEWTPSWIRGYVDGVMFFEDTNVTHLPPRQMHPTIQLDWFPSSVDLTPVQQSTMDVAWLRIYDLDDVEVDPDTPTWVGSTGGSTGGTSLSLPAPSGVTSGDHQLVILGLGSTGETFSAAPSGWTLLQQTSDAGVGFGNDSYRVAVFYSNTDAGTASFGKSAGTRLLAGVRCAWRGGAGPDLATDTFVIDNTGTSHPLPGQDAVPAGSTVVGVIVVDQGDELSTSFTGPGGAWVERYDQNRAGGDTEAIAIGVFDFPVTVTGDVDASITASRADGSTTFSVVLRP